MEKFFVTEARDLSDGILSGQQRKKKKSWTGTYRAYVFFFSFTEGKN
jgi:hypothetical protein